MDVPTIESLNLIAALPTMIVAVGAGVILLIELFLPKEERHWLAILSVVVIAVGLWLTFWDGGRTDAFGGMYVADGFTRFVNIVALGTAFFAILMAYDYNRRRGITRAEFYPLLLFSTSGAMLMGAAGDLVIVFIALELLSIPLYIMTGIRRDDPIAQESALKYFLLGAFASAFLIYGIALTYGVIGSTSLDAVLGAVTSQGLTGNPLLLLGAGLMIVGLGFKVAAVPFHMWTPDVYQGAPTPVTAFMSVAAKVGGFGALLRVLVGAFQDLAGAPRAGGWSLTVWAVAAATMILGNLVALAQRDIKRMLAYSSIAHAGYILMAVIAAGEGVEAGAGAALFYLMAYMFTNLGAFAIVVAVEKDDGSGTDLDSFAGVGRSNLWLGLAMALFMLSLTGIPPLVGFFGKFYIFKAAIDAGLVWLAVIGAVTSVISAFYYVRVIVKMFLEEGTGEAKVPWALALAIGMLALGVLITGLLPAGALDMAEGVILALAP